MTPKQFITYYNGKGVDVDGKYGYQCVDLFDKYVEKVIGERWYPVNGAKDIWSSKNADYFRKMINTPSFVPKIGDVAIFNTGKYGHVAIATGKGNKSRFQTLDQNYPWGLDYNPHPASLNWHNYNNLIGFLRPKEKYMASSEYNALLKRIKVLEKYKTDHHKTAVKIIDAVHGNDKDISDLQNKLRNHNHPSVAEPPIFDTEQVGVLKKVADVIINLFRRK